MVAQWTLPGAWVAMRNGLERLSSFPGVMAVVLLESGIVVAVSRRKAVARFLRDRLGKVRPDARKLASIGSGAL